MTRRPCVDDPDVVRLVGAVAPGAEVADLGGTMSLNLRLEPAGVVLRIHQPFISRPRLTALQGVRRRLADAGLRVAVPLPWRGSTLFRCGCRWAELEPYLPSERPDATPEAYLAMFGAMGSLHRVLAGLDLAVPRPRVATYGPPATLRRLLPRTELAVRGDPAAAESARSLRRLAGRLRSHWISAAELPQQLLHGDVRLSNVPRAPDGAPVYFDFGFLAHRPRIHELAYSLSWMLLRPDSQGTAESFPWDTLPGLVAAYEEAARVTLTQLERRALVPYTAAVPIYLAALAGRMPDPIGHLLDPTRQRFLRIGDWLLAHPHAVSAALARRVP